MENNKDEEYISNMEAIAIVVAFVIFSFFLNIIFRWGSKDPEDIKP
jgi:hypothetical protein